MTARRFFLTSIFSVFLKNHKKMTFFFEKKPLFLEKKATFLHDFSMFVALQRIQSQK